MRGRPATPLGSWGQIKTVKTGGKTQASCYLRLSTGNTVRVRATAPTKSAAITALKKRCTERLETPDNATLNESSKLIEVIDAWKQTKTHLRPQTLDRYNTAIDKHIKPQIGQIRLNELTPQLVDNWLRGIPAGTASNALSVLKGTLSMAVRWGLLKTSPLTYIQPPKTEKRKPKALTAKQIGEFRHDIKAWAKETGQNSHTSSLLSDVVDFALSTGLRLGEILAIRWQDIDGDQLKVTGTVVQTSKDGNIRQDVTKTDTSTRVVALNNTAMSVIERRKREPWATIAEMVFPSVKLTYMSENNFNRIFRKAKGEKWKWVTVHTLRKTVATIVSQELGTQTASHLLGHADSIITQRVYIARNSSGVPVGNVLDQVLAN